MKKKMIFVFIFSVLLLATGCGKDKKTIICKVESRDDIGGYNYFTEHTIKTIDGMVSEVTTVESMEYDESFYNENAIKDAMASFTDFYKAQNEVYGGFENKVEVDGKKVTSTTIQDYEKINMDKFLTDNVVLKEYASDDKKIKVEGLIELYKSLGATCDNEK